MASGVLPSGGVFGGVAGGVAGGWLGSVEEWPPRPKIFWMKFWGLSDIWLQVLTGAVPSRKAALKVLLGAGGVGRRLVALSMRAW